MNGYRNNPEETAHQHKRGRLPTGDISEMDEDGFAILWTGKKT
jgi:long-subunit acyl-CoA synthetase (AMP-forming)